MRSTNSDTAAAGIGMLLAALLLAGCGDGVDPQPQVTAAPAAAIERPNVLLIVVDTLRADHLGAYGYPLDTSPNLDRFAAENLKFNYAISAAPWTSPSMASIFSGFYPTAHGVTQHVDGLRMPDDALSDDFVTLAEVLKDAGYSTSGISANTWVSIQRGYAQGFDHFATILRSRRARDVTKLAVQQLNALAPDPPFFLYLHYMDPHPPLNPAPNVFERFREELASLPPESQPAQLEKVAKYDGEIFRFDRWLGALFERLRELGLYESMVIALISDHGFPFMEHGADWHGRMLHNEDTHVPFILKLPGLQGEIDETVSTIDLFPTLVRALGLDPPPGVQGVSLLEALEERRRRGAFSEITVSRNHRSLVTHDATKLILAFDKQSHEEVSEADETGVIGLFRSRDDYREAAKQEDEAEIERLRRRLWATYQQSLEINRGVTPASAELSADTIEELRRLGYVE
jgi:arylsulfatase A-like enzyme